MEYRPLGTTGLEVSVIGLGCNHLGSQGPGRTRADMIRLLECAADRGVTFYDTADVYMEGESERLLGEVFGRRGRRVVVATKVGLRRTVPHGLAARVRPFVQAVTRRAPGLRRVLTRARHIFTGQDYSADYLRRAVEGSLKRLQADTIDLLQLHSPPASVIQRDDAFETLDSLRSQGKIRFYGVSFGSWREAAPRPEQEGLSTLQIPISLVDEAVIDSLMRWARNRGVGIIGNQPFKKGRLLGADVHARLGSLLHDGKRSLAQAMLRFVAQLDGVSTVITGTSSIAHLGENIEALDSPPLSAEEIERLRAPGWALESEP